MNPLDLASWVDEARSRTLALSADLSDEQIMGPRLAIVNPLRWEIAHVAWFQERWVLRHACGRPPIRADADVLWDSGQVAHDTRWDLPLPSRAESLAYMDEVRRRVRDRLRDGPPAPELLYFARYCVHHEDMHDEAFTYTRQTLGYPPPRFDDGGRSAATEAGPLPGDAAVPGGVIELGAPLAEPFVFDNEKWAHPVPVRAFRIARAATTQAEFAAFVDEGGYGRRDLWSDEGWAWRASVGAEHPVYWRREAGRWQRRHFDRWTDLEPHRPVIHVSCHEAEAYCRWSGRRLPTEVEWETAAAGLPRNGSLAARKRRFPWGDEPPAPEHANLDWVGMGCVDVGALPAGDSAFGCRQMIGNVWEWTSTDFAPYPGFVADAYGEYSQPWFRTHKVLRGGAWTTRSRLLRNTWRNFYTPDRRDVLAGFRTCAV